jgi:hypothetical protein
MELNELIGELQRYQAKSADRSSRVGDSAVAQEPIEKHLDDFFNSRDDETQEKLADSNVVMIALPDQEGGAGGGTDGPDIPKPARPGDNTNPDDPNHPYQRRHPKKTSLAQSSRSVVFGAGGSSSGPPVRNHITLGPSDIDNGIRRDNPAERQLAYAPSGAHSDVNRQDMPVRSVERRTAIFRRLNR